MSKRINFRIPTDSDFYEIVPDSAPEQTVKEFAAFAKKELKAMNYDATIEFVQQTNSSDDQYSLRQELWSKFCSNPV